MFKKILNFWDDEVFPSWKAKLKTAFILALMAIVAVGIGFVSNYIFDPHFRQIINSNPRLFNLEWFARSTFRGFGIISVIWIPLIFGAYTRLKIEQENGSFNPFNVTKNLALAYISNPFFFLFFLAIVYFVRPENGYLNPLIFISMAFFWLYLFRVIHVVGSKIDKKRTNK